MQQTALVFVSLGDISAIATRPRGSPRQLARCEAPVFLSRGITAATSRGRFAQPTACRVPFFPMWGLRRLCYNMPEHNASVIKGLSWTYGHADVFVMFGWRLGALHAGSPGLCPRRRSLVLNICPFCRIEKEVRGAP
ncbi:hypothetical protein LZ32DRAFT_365001 [Colletotrichum eremochloae]|nr:hypothetical protein LZ32DRAFT_365001 [Colletotrichum eremochloae]